MIHIRGSSWQVDLRHEGQRIRRSFPDAAAAQAWEEAALRRLAAGQPLAEVLADTRTSRNTLQSLYNAVEARFWRGSKNEINATRNAEEVIDLLGPLMDPAHITGLDVDALVAKLKAKGNGPATINRKLAALRKLLKYAQSRGLLDRLPPIEHEKEPQHRIRFYTPEEETTILNWFEERELRLQRELVVFLVDTGARLSEALRLEWTDVLEDSVKFEDTKSGRARGVPMTKRVKQALTARRKVAGPGLVFPGIDVQSINYRWQLMRKDTGITDKQAVIHTLRHTCASRLVQAGVPLTVIQQWLGHSTPMMTARYAHLAPKNLALAAGVLDTLNLDRINSDPMRIPGAGSQCDRPVTAPTIEPLREGQKTPAAA